MLSDYLQNRNYLFGFFSIIVAALAGYLIGVVGLTGITLLVMIPILLAVVVGVLMNPRLGLFLYLQLAFLVPFVGHFIPVNAPIGTSVEGMLGLTMISLFLNAKKMHWHRLHNLAFYVLLIWIGFTFLEFFNPETPNRVPSWLYRFRSVSFQWVCAAMIVSVCTITRRDIKILLTSWIFWSVIAAIWAFRQQYVGLTPSEQVWMDNFGAKTHMLFGHLRSFSFFSDAAQLGTEMAGLTLICFIFSFEFKGWLLRILFFALAVFFFWGYAVTGTRSALFIILVGFPFYLAVKRDVTKIIIGGLAASAVLFVLMFTNIGNGNYQIYRMRTALRPDDDPSFNLRKANQKVLAEYLRPLPFGVGLGTSMAPGDIYNPDHWAAQIAPDTWYVLLWIETGKVGVTIYVSMLLSFVLIGIYKIWHLKDDWLRIVMTALLAEFVGVAVMAYANTIMGQFPTSTMLFINTFLFTTCDRWNTPSTAKESVTSADRPTSLPTSLNPSATF